MPDPLNITQIPAPRVELIDPRTGLMSREWFRFFNNIYTIAGSNLGIIQIINGGTGLSTYPTNGQLLIGDTAGQKYVLNTLTAESGIGVTNGAGTIGIANTGVLSNVAGTGISVSGTTGNVTISNTGVLSFSGGSTGLIPVSATTGAVTLAGTLDVDNGGTGQTTYTNGQLLIGNTTGNTLTKSTLTAGTAISITNGAGSITVTNTLPDQTVALASGTGISVTGTYPSFTITNTSPSSGGTVTAVTGTAPIASSGGTTPAISISQSTTSTNGYLSSTDWNTFNNKQPSGTYVTSVGATSPVTSSGGTTPTIAIPAATTSVSGYLTSTDWNTFNNKQPAGTYVTSISVTSSNGLAGTVTSGATPAITLSTSITGILKGNGTAISAATSGTDYAPATSGTSILYGNGSGGFSNVTIGTGVSFVAGTLSATGSGGTVTSVTGTAPVVSSGGTTPAISMPAATTSVNGYLTSTDWTTFNNKGSGTVTSITSTTLTIGGTSAIPTINLTSGIVTAGTTGSSTLIPVITVDTYGRVTTITTATNPQGTVTSVAALTLGTTGTDLSSTVATGTTTPVITLNVPTASATNRGALSAADWTTFNSKGSGTVTSVTGTAPVVSSGGTTPAISMAAATTSVNGYLTSTDWTTFNGKQAALVSGTNIKTVSGTSLLGSGDVGTIGATYGGTGQSSYAVGDILYASTTTALSKLADVATGNALISGGVGVAPSYGKIGLTTHVSGTLPVANGGTGVTTSTGTSKTVLSSLPSFDTTIGVGAATASASGSGISFPASQSASTDANTLDDYEEGTWTPQIAGDNIAGSGTYTTQVGTYTKIGRIVYLQGNMTWTAHTGSGNMLLWNFPFTSNTTANVEHAVSFAAINNITLPALSVLTGTMGNNKTYADLRCYALGTGAAGNVSLDTAGTITFSIVYEV